MDSRFNTKSDLYLFGGYVLLALALLVNPISIILLEGKGIVPAVAPEHPHSNDIRYVLPGLFDVFCVVTGLMVIFAPKRLKYYLNDSIYYNFFMLVLLTAIMFSLNVVLPGKFKGLRILYLLVILFFLTNTLFQAVVKPRNGQALHPFYRNIAVSVFGVLFVLYVFEGIFMFHQTTHRFNATLGSRAWFMHNWELNAEGYRDAPYDTSDTRKKKVLVIGDSFVAGHGVKNPKDRFSDRLQAKLPPNEWRVYNLGVGGSDALDENERLRKFPFKPDVLVLSWYPNDIEDDGERAGLILQHARSYHDLWAPARYVVRRSYLWNYIYWRYPHPDELMDYVGYIRQCFQYQKVWAEQRHQLERLAGYGDSLHIPTVAVVFPFLDNAMGSVFATQHIEEHYKTLHVPVLSVRSMLLNKPAADYIVNQNDPHPNERLHAMIADSLYARLNRLGAWSKDSL